MDDDDIWCDGPVIIDEAARRLTVPPGAQSGNNYGDLLGLVKDYEALARLRKFLQLAHRCGENDLCNPMIFLFRRFFHHAVECEPNHKSLIHSRWH